jgi:hypothetical protein
MAPLHAEDDLTVELEAIQAIGKALSRIQDPRTRACVLHWAIERFAAASDALAPVETRRTPATDPSLTVDGMELFGEAPQPAAALPAAPARQDEPLDSLVRGFAGDLRRLAALWQVA